MLLTNQMSRMSYVSRCRRREVPVASCANCYEDHCEILLHNLENEPKDQEELHQGVHWIVFLAWWN